MIGDGDTIVASATPPGRGGLAVIRVSGPAAIEVSRQVAGSLPPPRRLSRRTLLAGDGLPVDDGMVVVFPAPRSFTGEDVVELHCHGGPVIVDLLLQSLLSSGARMARPGEFSRRAFLNDRMDLAQAEAVADLIEAGSSQAARAALRSLQGEFSDRVHRLAESVTELRVYVEAAMDFPEEEIDFLSDATVADRIEALSKAFTELTASATQGALLREGMTVVLAGAPNVGKSSLLNRLTGQPSAIVTHLPGTTRDVLRERISIEGMPLHVIDTAGLRDAVDPVEAEGVRRARQEMEKADLVLLLVDAAETDPDTVIEMRDMSIPEEVPVTVVRNKVDLTSEPPGVRSPDGAGGPTIGISALHGQGIADLRRHLEERVGYEPAAEGAMSARRRHLDALDRARGHVRRGAIQLLEHGAPELMAEELRLAHHCLGEITGEISSEDLLGRIFSSFCIGK
ncbi:MAG: tRNA uridine-5-carboxymethylaminomethyl(34) synthesis GTPase MnmE [Gammaproteobacteria bacterium]